MALADTARLIASLELQDKFSPGLGRANRSLNTFQGNLDKVGTGVGQLGAGVGRVATSLVKFGVIGAAALGGFIAVNLRSGVAALHELELQQAATTAAIKSTGGAAGQTADAIRTLAEKYEDLNATIDDKVIQSAENVLLTFPKITHQAFEPALEAALNLNQALGGGPEGLQNEIIRVGKALQDPIRGLTSLRRVGVSFTKEQEAQIKALVKQNDLFGAQKIILDELAVEFGGRFAAAGDTAAGRTAKLKDNIEDLQKTFAGPFASVLDRITGKLGDFLGEAGTVSGVKNLGDAIAGLFTDDAIDRGIDVLRSGLDLLSPENLGKAGDALKGVFDVVKGIDFGTIGKGLEITARVAKTAIDAFLSLPKEAQAVVIGALAANKLSGGLIGSGIGSIAKGLTGLAFGGLTGRGSSAANPLWVQSVGGLGGPSGPTGPTPVPTPTGGGTTSLLKSVLAGLTKVSIFGLVALTVGEFLAQNVTRPLDPVKFDFNQVAGASGEFTRQEGAEKFAQGLADKLDIPLEDVKAGIVDAVNNQGLTFDEAVILLESQHTTSQKILDQAIENKNVANINASKAENLTRAEQAELARINQSVIIAKAEANAKQGSMLQSLERQHGTLQAINSKDFAPKINVTVPITTIANISVSAVTRTLTSFYIAGGTGVGGAAPVSSL